MDRYPAFPNAHGQVGRGRGRGSVFQPSRRLAMNEPNQGGFGRGRGDGDRYLFARKFMTGIPHLSPSFAAAYASPKTHFDPAFRFH